MELKKKNTTIGKLYNIDGNFYLVSKENKLFYDSDFSENAPLCQTGICNNCKAKLISWAKHTICPICEKKCYLT